MTPAPIPAFTGPLDRAALAQLCRDARPVVMRGLVAQWPVVAAARSGDRALVDYLLHGAGGAQVSILAAHPEEGGRLFYDAAMTRFNFDRATGPLSSFLEDLLRAAAMDDPPALAVQSAPIPALLPRLAKDNRIAALAGVEPRIWIGNRIRVAAHYDARENIACCIAGRRRFTLFPPEQIGNLYPGPLETTPAGTPVSLVDIDAPDLARFPRYADARAASLEAELEPGDAIFIPYGWWHAVASLSPINALVNYWWSEGEPAGIGSPYDALLQGLASFRHLPPAQRAAWRAIFSHYAFADPDQAADHIPLHARGVLSPPSPELFARMRAMLSSR